MSEDQKSSPFSEPISKLRSTDPSAVADRCGGIWIPSGPGAGEGQVLIKVLDHQATVEFPEMRILIGEELSSFTLRLLLLLYLCNSDGTDPSHEWSAYRELPDGRFYQAVLTTSVEEPMASRFGNDLDGFRTAAGSLGGRPTESGDASFELALFPKVLLSFIMWEADDEFPARAQVLFDSNCAHHLNAFELRMGAQEVSKRLMARSGSA